MDRRSFNHCLAFLLAGGSAACAQQPTAPAAAARWQQIEAGSGGRLGVAVLDTGSGQLHGHRLDERFPMCSTFKWLAAAVVLQRVDAGQEQLDRRLRYGRDVLLPHSPVTEKHLADGMTLAQLCEATITTSDNAAANLILDSYGGPPAVTRFARALGDPATRLDRREPELNDVPPGDVRDTTTPRAMAGALRAALFGPTLSAASRARLAAWLEATETNRQRLRADLPAGWRMGSKTGSGPRGTTNDVGVFWPPGGRAPIVVAAYLTDTTAPDAARNGAIAQVARAVTRAN